MARNEHCLRCRTSLNGKSYKWCATCKTLVRQEQLKKATKTFVSRTRRGIKPKAENRQLFRHGRLTKWALKNPEKAAWLWTRRTGEPVPRELAALVASRRVSP